MPNKKIRVLHIISSLQIGGAEIVFRDLLQELVAKEFDHQVLYFYDGPLVAKIKDLGIVTYQIKGLFCRYDPVFLWRLAKHIWQFAPDCIDSHLWAANVLATSIGWFLGIPVVCVLHLAALDEKKSKKNNLRSCIERWTTSKASGLIAVSKGVKQEYINQFGPRLEQIRVIPNGINQDYVFEQAKKVTNFVKKQDQFIIGSVGRFIPRKNYTLLIQSFAQLSRTISRAHLLIVGFGPEQEKLEALIHELHLADKVTLIIGKPAYSYYPFFDLFVQPSLSEGLSIALLEAMSFGICPIVTGRDHSVITHQSNGLIIEPTRNDLIDAISRMYHDRPLAKRLGNQAKKTVNESYTIEKMAKQYEIIFKSTKN